MKKGQVLAVLDPEPYQLEVDAGKAELAKARDNVTRSKAEYERQKRIFEQGAGAKRYMEVAEYSYKAAASAVDLQVARLDLANRNLRKTTMLSPYDGTIASRSVQPHEEVQAGQKVFEINATGKMEVQLAVPETTIGRIHIGGAATITFPTLPGGSAKGRISYIGSAAAQANAFPVKVALTGPNEKVKPGMTAEVNLDIQDENRQPGYMLPIQAILPAAEANQGYVFVYDPPDLDGQKNAGPLQRHGTKNGHRARRSCGRGDHCRGRREFFGRRHEGQTDETLGNITPGTEGTDHERHHRICTEQFPKPSSCL